MKGKTFTKRKWGFQSIFKMTPFETRRDQDFIKQSLFANTLFDKSLINHFGNKSIFEEGSDSLLNRENLPKGFIVILVIFEHLWIKLIPL